MKHNGLEPTRPMSSISTMPPISLNLRGLKCPLPALRVRKALKSAEAGALLLVECTDPMAAIDIPNLLQQTGDTIEHHGREGDLLVFHIRKANPQAATA